MGNKEAQAKWRLKNPDYQRRWKETNREKWNAHKRGWGLAVRLEVLRHYSRGEPQCLCCGENKVEFLGIDHINSGGGLRSIGCS